jgi:TolB-like protein
MSSFFEELKRRNVFRVGVAYVITAWLLAQVADLALESFEAPAWVMKTILLVLLIGFPLALIFAWAFEKTPEGIKLEKNVDRSQSITPVTGKKLDRGIIAVLGVAVIFLLYKVNIQDEVREAPAQPGASAVVASGPGDHGPAEPSIAVLPFINMSNDPANEYFSDGISEELLNVLVKVSGIKVASRTSSFAFKGKDVSIPDIASQLKVDHVLEGSVRKSGNKVRVTAQLIEVHSDRHLWSETYDRELEDIFAIQDEISGHIVDALKVALGAGEQQAMAQAGRPTASMEAYELYLQGRYFWQRRGEENIRKAIELFVRATDIDASFAKAWSALAAAYVTLPTYSDVPQSEAYPMAWESVQKALALDDSMAEAYAVMGDLTRDQFRWAEAERYYLAGLEREPRNVTALLWYGEYLFQVGRLAAALRQFEMAYERDPLSPGAAINLSVAYLALGRDADGIKLAQVGFDLGHPGGMVRIGWLHLSRGEYEQAIAAFERFEAAVATAQGLFSATTRAIRDGEQTRLARALRDRPPQVAEPALLSSLVALGDIDGAYAVAQDRFDQFTGNDWFVVWNSGIEPFRQDPRFAQLLQRLGLVAYWREHGWPDLCEPDGEGVTCR